MRSPPRAYYNFCSPSLDQETKKLNWAPPPDPLNSVLCCLITVDVSTLPLGSVDTGREKLMGWIGGTAVITSFIITDTSSTCVNSFINNKQHMYIFQMFTTCAYICKLYTHDSVAG